MTQREALSSLPARQREVLDTVIRYYRVTGEACPSSVIARKLSLHHSTVQGHFLALNRKGWLRSATAPAMPTRW